MQGILVAKNDPQTTGASAGHRATECGRIGVQPIFKESRL
jgi:hypothetical protein